MINLLPDEERRQLNAARTNVLLLRYNILMLAVVLFVCVAIGITYFYLSSAKSIATETLENNTLRVSRFAKVESEASMFRNNLSIAKKILDKEITYSKIILEISRLIPSGIVIDGINLDAETFGTETLIVANAKSNSDALKLKETLQNSKIFSDVHFRSVTTSSNTDYPIIINLSVTIKKDVI